MRNGRGSRPKFGTGLWRVIFLMSNIMSISASKKAEPAFCRLSFKWGGRTPPLTNLLRLFFVLCGTIFEKQNSDDGINYPVIAVDIIGCTFIHYALCAITSSYQPYPQTQSSRIVFSLSVMSPDKFSLSPAPFPVQQANARYFLPHHARDIRGA